jgi:hypothetical protein
LLAWRRLDDIALAGLRHRVAVHAGRLIAEEAKDGRM